MTGVLLVLPEAVAELLRAMFGVASMGLTGFIIYYLLKAVWVVFKR